MANDRSNIGAPHEFIAWLGGLLMALVAGEDLRVRQVIARAAIRARPRLHPRHDPANRRAE
jgi:hypothetical protein